MRPASQIALFNEALNFMPETPVMRRATGAINAVALFFAAIGQGLAAANRYERLVAAGKTPGEAAAGAFKAYDKD
ncbi:MAG: hypothetical protein AB7K67_17385 [Hyphomicrobiaceae bacterium]